MDSKGAGLHEEDIIPAFVHHVPQPIPAQLRQELSYLVEEPAPRPAVVIADNAMRAASGTLALPCEM